MSALEKGSGLESVITYKIAAILANEHIEPNYITIFNIIPSVLALYYIYHDDFLWFCIYLIIRIILDSLDGYTARKFNKVSKFGELLDCIQDTFFWSILLYILLKNKVNNIILFVIILSFIIVIQDWSYFPIMTELFDIAHDNTIVFAPIVSYVLYKLPDTN